MSYMMRNGCQMVSRPVFVKPRRLVVCRALPQDYIDAYSRFVCRGDSECVVNIDLPPIEEQARILNGLIDIKFQVDTQGLEGVFIELLKYHDYVIIGKLMVALQMYAECVSIISEIVGYTLKN